MIEKYSEVQINFVGDITCDRPMLAAAQQDGGRFNFEDSFKNVREVLSSGDCVIGNLETVFAGEEMGYNPGLFSYNSPDALCKALSGITDKKLILTTANNHCLDGGKIGVSRTLRLLKQCGIASTGTHEPGQEEFYHVEEIHGVRLGVVSYTACMNQRENGMSHSRSEMAMVNSLTDINFFTWKKPVKIAGKYLIKKLRKGRMTYSEGPLIKPRKDNYDIPDRDKPLIDKAIETLKKVKMECDCVILCVHSGGQFNDIPGKYTENLVRILEPYADMIVCNHPHVIQKVEVRDGKLIAYSLGSLNMSPSGDYVSFEHLPQYSLMLSVSLTKNGRDGECEITDVSYRILKAVEDDRQYLSVWNTQQLQELYKGQLHAELENDLNVLHSRIGRKQ